MKETYCDQNKNNPFNKINNNMNKLMFDISIDFCGITRNKLDRR